jgi:methionyl-tRNA formyltransferase
MKKKLSIVYMGTPEFAVPPLKAIIDAGYPVSAVVTSPDKPAGRGKKIQASDVKIYAGSVGLKVIQPPNLKDPGFLEQLKSLNADLQVVVAFRMLPEQVWRMPPKGTINLHASLLPQYRGAAPINHVIMNGEKITGVSTFFINQDIDTGQIIRQKKVIIPENFTAGELHDVLMNEGARLIIETIELVEQDRVDPIPQGDLIKINEVLKPAPKIFREDCRIEWTHNVLRIYNFIRGLSPSPTAYAYLKGPEGKIPVKFFRAGYKSCSHNYNPGKVLIENRKEFYIAAPDGFIYPQLLQQAGKKPMDSGNFLNGIPDFDQYSFE